MASSTPFTPFDPPEIRAWHEILDVVGFLVALPLGKVYSVY